ncbi:MAG: putative quinol monooxygenase [Pseudomonadota bacterium]
MIFVIATLTAKPGTQDAIREAALPCIEATSAEEGCISYDLHQSLTDENTMVFVERWKDRAAIDAHFGLDHLRNFVKTITPHLTGNTIEIIENGSVSKL